MPVLHMETDSVRSTGQALGSAAAILADQMFDLQVSVNSLANGWQGPASDIFISEITPWLRQINQLVEEASTLRDRVFREADEWERVDSMMGGAAATLGVLFANQVRQTIMGTLVGGIAGTAANSVMDAASKYDFAPREPDKEAWKWDFKPMEMIDYVPNGARADGAEENALSTAMITLSELVAKGEGQEPDKVYPLLEIIARERDIPYNQIQQDYQEFLYLAEKHPPQLTQRDDYWGTVQQLRFGTVVGDTLGIDAVFGALLRPTGGLVGPDDGFYEGIPVHDNLYTPDSAIAYHGVYHDAAGFLPGLGVENVQYEYIIPQAIDPAVEAIAFAKLPPIANISAYRYFQQHPELDGQIAGILYWNTLLTAKKGQEVLNNIGNVVGAL